LPKSPPVHISTVLALLAIALPAFAQAPRARATARLVTQVLPASNRADSIRVLTFDPAVQPAPVAVGGGPVPRSLDLVAPSPNPARFFVRLGFALPRAARVSLEVLDLQGRRVRTLVSGPLAAERYAFGWDLRDAAGREVAPGLYLIRLSDGGGSITRRIAVIR